MSRSRKCLWVSLGFLVWLVGCASSARDDGRESVGKLAQERTAYSISLERDPRARQRVGELLSRPLNVDQAVQLGLLNSPELAGTFEELGVARGELIQAGLLRNPVFDASIRWPSSGGPNVELAVTQSFMELLFISARKKIAGAEMEGTKARVAHEVLRTAAAIRNAFVSLQADQQMLDLRRQAIASFEASADLGQRLYAAGNISELQMLTEKASLEQARTELDQAEIELVRDRERLITLLGLEDGSSLKITERLLELPSAEPEPGHLEHVALEQRLDLAAARARIEASARTLGLTRSTRFLTDGEVGVDTEREIHGDRVTGPVFSIPIPLFDFGQGAMVRARAQLNQARRQYQAMVVQVRSDVRRSYAQLTQSRMRADRYWRSLLPLRHQITQQAALHYNGMYLGPFELLRIKQEEISTAKDAIGALRDYWIERSDLELAVGGTIRALPTTRPSTVPAAASRPTTSAPAPAEQHQHHH